MSNKMKVAGLVGFMAVIFVAPLAFAAEGAATGQDGGLTSPYALMALGCVIGLGLAAHGGGIGMGNAVSGAVNAMSRNPGFYGKIFTNMLIGLALIESLVIYTLVIVLVLLYANPLV